MDQKKLLQLKAAIYQMGLLFNQQPTDERIDAYAKSLINYTEQQVIYAFNQVIKSGSAFFPSLAEIIKHLQPVDSRTTDPAPAVASEIINLIRRYGPHDEKNMIIAASDNAKLVLQKLGYTGDIRNSENIETTKAQLERLARSVLANYSAEMKNEKLKQIGIDPKNVLSQNKPEMKKISF